VVILLLLTQTSLFQTETQKLVMPLILVASLFLPAAGHAWFQARQKQLKSLPAPIPLSEEVDSTQRRIAERKMVA
jgi:hypothetical protein